MLDVVLGRSGNSLKGHVLNKGFRIASDFGEITVETKNISRIDFRKPGPQSDDTIYMRNNDQVSGKIEDAAVGLRTTGEGDVNIPTDKVLDILFAWISEKDAAAKF